MRALTTSLSLVLTVVSAALAVDLAPVADTYIEEGWEAGADHGRSRILEVDRSPFGVMYLRFDLRNVRGTVTAAILRLQVINGSRDAGDVYRIPVGEWDEGLRWIDVDRNSDGELDERDRSLFAPDPARVVGTVGAVTAGDTVEIDVTPAFAGGPGLYTLAIENASADGASFWSSEDVFRSPVLDVMIDDPTPDPGPATPACLSQTGPLLLASGIFTGTWSQRSLARATRVDARAGVFIGGDHNNYPITLGGSAGVCLAGGLVAGQYDRSASWQEMHDENNAGVTFDSPGLTVEGVRIDNVTDGIRPRANSEGFRIRGVHMSYVRDDCVEDDHANGGAVEDSLLDGCYVAFSSRPVSDDADGRARVWRVENSLVRLAPMPGPRPGSNSHPDGLGHGPFFKVDLWDDPPNSRSPRFVLRNNIFRADRVGQESARRMGIPPGHVIDCANNVMVWLGPGSYPARLPSCFRVTTDRRVWDDAVAVWLERHGER